MRYLGIDFGLRRIGLAISEGEYASAWKIVKTDSLNSSLKQILNILEKEKFDKVVIGVPESGKVVKAVKGLINKLKVSGINVEAVEETLSSKIGKQRMIELGLPQKKRRFDDAYSAVEILQNYLEKGKLDNEKL